MFSTITDKIDEKNENELNIKVTELNTRSVKVK
jgi:hypothetical protein